MTTELYLPWTAGLSDDGRVVVRDARGFAIAEVRGNPHIPAPVEASVLAQYLAAAPSLVAGLQHMEWCGSCAEDPWESCERGGRAARAALEAAPPQNAEAKAVAPATPVGAQDSSSSLGAALAAPPPQKDNDDDLDLPGSTATKGLR